MIPNLEQLPITYLVGSSHLMSDSLSSTEKMGEAFADKIMECLTSLGQFLMKEGRVEPDIVAAGFWLRESQLNNLKSNYSERELSARGVIFHIAPGNVDSLFFYSIILSILCGNCSILRVSDRLSGLTRLLLNLINQFIIESPLSEPLKSLMFVVQYEHNDSLTEALSNKADVRVIWGGDKTVKHISTIPMKSDGEEVTFPDRYSAAVLHLADATELNLAVEMFSRDVNPFLQQACSSPKIVYWLNTEQSIQKDFWTLLSQKLFEDEGGRINASERLEKLIYLQRLALLSGSENIIVRRYHDLETVELSSFALEQLKAHRGLFTFLTMQIESLDEIELYEHCQTVTTWGLNEHELAQWLKDNKQPMKRVVPAGQALIFSHLWDGIDLIESFTHHHI